MITKEGHDPLGGPTRINVGASMDPGHDRRGSSESVDRAIFPTTRRRTANAVHLNGDRDRSFLIRKAHHLIALPSHMKKGSRLLGLDRRTETGCHWGVGGKHPGPLRP